MKCSLISFFALVVLASLVPARLALALDVEKPAVAQFITQMVKKHGFERAQLTHLLAATAFDPGVIKRMNAPAEALPWYRYRAIFVTAKRIRGGRDFMAAQKKPLATAERRYGVPPAVITALIGMESRYGENEGNISALSALATLAFDYPRRAEFFRRELTQYLLLCRRNNFDPRTLKSSYAGALGAGQFMPSSYLAYAVDADGGGINMFSSWPDITASIAHFLARHGWRAGKPVAARAALKPDAKPEHLVGRELTARDLENAGIVFDAPVAATASARLVKVETQGAGNEQAQYWVGLHNFSVLMSYNHSPLYALAAAQLAAAIAAKSQASSSNSARKP
ncbi:MAG: lytic murein transglycosylase B [Gammaproteobacteria bacterium]